MNTRLLLRSSVGDKAVKAAIGRRARYEDAVVYLNGDAGVYKPNGDLLLRVCRGRIDSKKLEAAFAFMYALRNVESFQRGAYAGINQVLKKSDNRNFVHVNGRYRAIKADGTISNTALAGSTRSAVVGGLDRNTRNPFCRQTVYSTQYADKWAQALPFIGAVSEMFREVLPDRFRAQEEAAEKVYPLYRLPGTAFTTITVNNTVAGAYHTDKGDYGPGFGVMAVLRKGTYRGSQLVFPKYGVAADLAHGDVIFFDPHEVHGNIPFHDTVGGEGVDWIRISMVFYFRTKMLNCLSPEAELERAKNLVARVTK